MGCFKSGNIFKRLLSFMTAKAKDHTVLVALFVIRGHLGFWRPSRSRFTVWCFLRGWSVSLLDYFVKNWTWVIVFEGWRVFFGTLIWQRFTKVSCLPTYHREKFRTRSTLEVKICRERITPAWLTACKYLEWQTVFVFVFTTLNCFS